ncbi:MAG: IS200/IS605 family transposase [Bulleidia sp.]|nr:IS200/IS605 family transposase [Bulleidia sp.]
MHKYQHRRHNKNLLMAHIILVAKYRKPILTGSIREDIMQSVYDTCKRYHWYIKKMETDKNHIHLLIQYNPTDSITKIVSRLKQYTTWQIWKMHYKELSHYYWKEHTFWSYGYFAASIGEVSQSTIEHYTENQG